MFKTCIEAQYIVQTAEYEDHLGIHTFHQHGGSDLLNGAFLICFFLS